MNLVPIGQTKGKQRCVISLGVGKTCFTASLKRLEQSLRHVGFQGDFLSWDTELPGGCPSHFEAPFCFKTYCFYTAKRLGYKEVLWIDSTCVAIRSLNAVFDDIASEGYVFFNNNYDQMMGQWISDEALAQNMLTRDKAMTIPELPCSVMGLNMESNLANTFLDQWHQIMSDGITARGTSRTINNWEDYQAMLWNRNHVASADPRVKGHRCDQAAAGIVAHRLGMIPYADYLRDIHYKPKPVKRNTSILHYREFSDQITSLKQIYHQIFFHEPWIETPRRRLRTVVKSIRSINRIRPMKDESKAEG